MMQSKKVDSELHLFMRASTKLLHQKLDHHPLLASLLCPQLSLAQYLCIACNVWLYKAVRVRYRCFFSAQA